MNFTEEQIQELKQNKYVEKVTTKSISFTKEFKELFVKESSNGKGPTRIFIESDFNPYILGSDRIKGFSRRIKKKVKNNQSYEDNRGKKLQEDQKRLRKRN